jgi:serine protease Do
MINRLSVLPAILIAPLVLAGSAAGQSRPARAVADTTAIDLSRSIETMADAVGPSVVEIFATSFAAGEGLVSNSADLVTTQRASGSGVIVDADGFIVTNAHVVRGAQRLLVSIPAATAGRSILATTGRRVKARLIGLDLETDLAVLKVDEPRLPALPFGDSDDLNPGQIVLAFGSPLGLHNSVSFGVVSAVARQLEPESPMIYVQTDASINPGSSGGPLVDLRGRLVGINTLIVSQAGGNEGLGFAAPSNIVRAVYEQIKKSGRVRRGDIGIRVQTVTPALAAGLALTRDHGVILEDVVPRSTAALAGLQTGDVVISLDAKPMENGRQLKVGLYRRLVGDVVVLEVERNGRAQKFPVAVAERHDPLADLPDSIDPRQNLVPRLGILGVDLTPPLAQLLSVTRVRSGVVVASTVANALEASEGGLAAGDIISTVNRTPVGGLEELRAILDRLPAPSPAVLQIERRGELQYLVFTLD